MKKLLVITASFVLILACFTACGKTTKINSADKSNASVSKSEIQTETQTESETQTETENKEINPPEERADKETSAEKETLKPKEKANSINSDKVYVFPTEQNRIPDPLPESRAQQIRSIIKGYKMSSPSWDNISDYTVIANGNYYYYDSDSGIITLDDTHADRFSNSDRLKFNKLIGAPYKETTTGAPIYTPRKSDSEAPATYTGTMITDTFLVKSVNGTSLVLARYDLKNGEYKEGLYSCNYGNLYGSNKMEFHVGEVVTIRYDQKVAETYPIQLTVREIYPAEWN